MKNSIKLLLLGFVSIASIEASEALDKFKNSEDLTWQEIQTIATSFHSDLKRLNCNDEENLKLISQAINFYKESMGDIFCSTIKLFNRIDSKLKNLFLLAYSHTYCSAKFNTDKWNQLSYDSITFPIIVQTEAMKAAILYLGWDKTPLNTNEAASLELGKIFARIFSVQAATYAIIFNKQHECIKEILDLYQTISDGNLNNSQFDDTSYRLQKLYYHTFMEQVEKLVDINPALNSLFRPHSNEIFTNNFVYMYGAWN